MFTLQSLHVLIKTYVIEASSGHDGAEQSPMCLGFVHENVGCINNSTRSLKSQALGIKMANKEALYIFSVFESFLGTAIVYFSYFFLLLLFSLSHYLSIPHHSFGVSYSGGPPQHLLGQFRELMRGCRCAFLVTSSTFFLRAVAHARMPNSPSSPSWNCACNGCRTAQALHSPFPLRHYSVFSEAGTPPAT